VHQENRPGLEAIRLDHIFWTLKQRAKLVTGCLAFGLLIGGLFVTLMPPKYKASAQFLFDPTAEQAVNPEQGLTASILTLKGLERVIALIQSPGTLKQVAADLMEHPAAGIAGLRTSLQDILQDPAPKDEMRLRRLMLQLQKDMTVKTEAADQIIIVEYQSKSPQEAAYVANLIVTDFIAARTSARKAAVSQAAQWLDERFAEAKEKLLTVDKEIQDYKTAHRIDDDAGSSAYDTQLLRLREQLATTQNKLTDTESLFKTLQDYDQGGRADYAKLADSLNDSNLQKLRASLAEAEGAAAAARERFGPYHPEVRGKKIVAQVLRDEIEAEARRKLSAAKGDLQILRNQQQQLNGSIKATEEKLHELRAAEVKLRELQREREAIKTLYDSMLARLNKTAPQQSFGFSDFKPLMDAAVPDRRKINPLIIVIAGGIGGLGMGIALALLLELLSGRLIHAEGVENELLLKVITRVPALSSRDLPGGSKKPKESVDPARYLQFAREFPNSLFTNCLLRAVLAARDLEAAGGGRIIMVTSPTPGNGKTLISSNLASLSVLLGERTLLIDLDARKGILEEEDAVNGAQLPELNAFLHEAGLSRALIAKREAEGLDVLRPRASGEAVWLQFIQPQLRRLLEIARQNYSYVWMDTPPAQLFSDALFLASQADAIIAIAEWSKTSKRQLKETYELLHRSGGKLLGVIINKVEVDSLISDSMSAYKAYYETLQKRELTAPRT
jgi:polysaccharide biosynthesis transport protein